MYRALWPLSFMRRQGVAAPAPYTVLLLGYEGADGTNVIADESPAANGNSTGTGTAQIDTAQFKFGACAGLFAAGSSTCRFPWADDADWHFGSGDFTIETFIRFSTVGNMGFMSQAGAFAGQVSWWLQRWSGNLEFGYSADGTATTAFTRAWTPVIDTWYHIVAERAGGVLRLYVDGAMLGAAGAIAATLHDSTQSLWVGNVNNVSFSGWLDETRISKGVARYNSDGGYTVPTAAFPR